MNVRDLLNDEGAVSPVIGVILMVAITVILAAVIGTFVLGLGDQVSSNAPQASFTFEFIDGPSGGDRLTVTHDGGDSIAGSQLSVTASVSNIDVNSSVGSGTWDTSASNASVTFKDIRGTGDVTAGTSVNVGNTDLEDQTVRIVWSSSGGDSTATLAKWEGPDA